MTQDFVNKASFRTTTRVAPQHKDSSGEVLFIASTSFETRCFHVAENLTQDYLADVALICHFRGDYEIQSRHDENLENLQAKLSFNSQSRLVSALRTYDLRSTLPELESQFGQLALNHNVTNIDFDVTTFTKQYILVILKLLEEKFPAAMMRVLYTPASQYGSYGMKRTLSRHVRSITAVPGFDMFRDSSEVPSDLVVFLGFEEERVLNLVDALSPKYCVPVLQLRRNTHFGAQVPVESNRRLLQLIKTRYNCEPLYLDAENPESTADFLMETYKERTESTGRILLIAPHGSKMQAVGTYLFCRIVGDPQHVGIIYAIPLKYEKRSYSTNPIGYIAEFTWQSAGREDSSPDFARAAM